MSIACFKCIIVSKCFLKYKNQIFNCSYVLCRQGETWCFRCRPQNHTHHQLLQEEAPSARRILQRPSTRSDAASLSLIGSLSLQIQHLSIPLLHAGYLSLLVNQVWREQWCCVSRGSLHFYHDKGDPRTSLPSLPLHGCEVVPGLGPKHPFAFRILRNSTELAALEVKRRSVVSYFTVALISIFKFTIAQKLFVILKRSLLVTNSQRIIT